MPTFSRAASQSPSTTPPPTQNRCSFYEGPNLLVIHPEECIDCALYVPECPVNAIFTKDELPEDQKEFLALNAELAAIWPNIKEMKPPPADAAEWKDVPGKRKLLER